MQDETRGGIYTNSPQESAAGRNVFFINTPKSMIASTDAEDQDDVAFPKTTEQLGRIQLRRDQLKQWIYAPFFDQVVVGCYVRILNGDDNGRAVYRVAEIVDVREANEIYSLDRMNTSWTNKVFNLRYGAKEFVFRLDSVSNRVRGLFYIFSNNSKCN